MRNGLILGLVLSLFIVVSCNNDDENPQEKYDGVELTTVLKSQCFGDAYGQGVNVIDLKLSTGSIHTDGAGMEFEGEGTCLVLSLFSKITDGMLPSDGSYNAADWNNSNLVQTFDPGYCEYQQDYGEWLASGTYVVTIDENGQKSYMALLDGELIVLSTKEGYEIHVALTDESGKVFKARYIGNINFDVPAPEDKYKYEEKTVETLAPLIVSVDVHNYGQDAVTGLVNYKITIWMEKQAVAQFMLYMPSMTKGPIPDGKYSVNEQPVENMLLAGYFENEGFLGSCLVQWDESFSHVMKVWYLVEGEFDIKSSEEIIEFTFNGSSAYGSSFIINYKGEYQYRDV